MCRLEQRTEFASPRPGILSLHVPNGPPCRQPFRTHKACRIPQPRSLNHNLPRSQRCHRAGRDPAFYPGRLKPQRRRKAPSPPRRSVSARARDVGRQYAGVGLKSSSPRRRGVGRVPRASVNALLIFQIPVLPPAVGHLRDTNHPHEPLSWGRAPAKIARVPPGSADEPRTICERGAASVGLAFGLCLG